MYKLQTKFKEFTVGSDPEFLIMKGRSFVPPVPNHYNLEKCGNLGHDGITGQDNIFEVRPLPSYCPLEMVRKIKSILIGKIIHSPAFLTYDYYAGSYVFNRSLGAHIHFGGPHCLKERMNYNDISLVLDNYIGIISVLLEDIEGGRQRRKNGNNGHGYGNSCDWRQQPHGFEYRVCASWMTSPYIAAAICSLAKVVVFEYLNNPRFDLKRHDYRSEFYYMDRRNLRNRFPDVWTDIQKMRLYNDFKPYIDLIYKLIKKNLSWFPQTSMKEAWGLIKPEILIPRERIQRRIGPIRMVPLRMKSVDEDYGDYKEKKSTWDMENVGETNYFE